MEYVLALIIGVSLGLLGGGGSILTVPVLVYVADKDPVLATAYSLFIVGVTSAIGAADYARQKLIDFKTAAVFAIPSFIAVFVVRKFVVPIIPEEIATFGEFVLTKGIALMVFFAIIMILAAASMLRKKKNAAPEPETAAEVKYNYPLILVEGLVVGGITGLVGAGGGFMIVPALVILARLPIKLAIGTSLLIISVKSLIGFVGDVMAYPGGMEWEFLAIFSVLASGGIFIGTRLAKRIKADSLKQGFGWFLIVMSIYILFKELF
ncbi:MAG: sulfite exporter TauE/SafE family protein [Bernardetiaceae bacterium]|nr:sulfite exporter TauE/SafE family protein [Bernardetiaceae bacterium]